MSLTAVDVAALVATGALSLSKLLSVAKPLWSKLPRWAAVLLPVFVLDLPQIAASFGLVQTGTSITTAIITSLALLAPGIAEAEEAKPAS